MAAKSRYSLKGRTRGSYLELVLAFPLASIKSEDQLLAAQGVMDRLLARGVLDAGESLYLDGRSATSSPPMRMSTMSSGLLRMPICSVTSWKQRVSRKRI